MVQFNVDGVDQATRKLIRSHVMRGKKQKKGKIRAHAGLDSAHRTQNTQVKLQDVIDMYMTLQPGRIGNNLYFVDFSAEIEPSMLLKMVQDP